MPQRHLQALFALLLTAASPPAGEVQHVPIDQALAILGQNVADPDGKDIGRLVDVLIGDQGQPQAAVIDFGGFMGVGNRKIAVEWSALHFAPGDRETSDHARSDAGPDQGRPGIQGCTKPAPVVVAPETPR